MTRRLQIFRIRYVGRSGPMHEVEITARNTADAIRAAREVGWPPDGLALRVIDTQGREVFEQHKSGLHCSAVGRADNGCCRA
jgi:hypothetical protein